MVQTQQVYKPSMSEVTPTILQKENDNQPPAEQELPSNVSNLKEGRRIDGTNAKSIQTVNVGGNSNNPPSQNSCKSLLCFVVVGGKS